MTKESQKNKIFFCGSILNYEGLNRYKGESPAASQWTRGLLQGIKENGMEVEVFCPIWDSLFPKGKLFPGADKYVDNSFKQKIIKYINFPFIRSFSLSYSLFRNIKKSIKNDNVPLAIINYNPSKFYCKAIKKIKEEFPNIIWINIVLDLEDPEVDNWKNFNTVTNGVDGNVFLSWWGFENSPVKAKLHLDSGWHGEIDSKIRNLDEKKIFVYAGKMQGYGGITDVINSIKQFPYPDVQFEFYGKGIHPGLQLLAQNDKRVIIKGFVTDEELNRACQKAFAFLAPQEVSFMTSKMIFPSKIIFYLKYQKAIISQALVGLSPDYNSILIHPAANTGIAWANAMKEIIDMSERDREIIAIKSRELLKMKRWDVQAKNLINFIKTI
jgi:glycosyltransferase involved in cell wall biosynthesis